MRLENHKRGGLMGSVTQMSRCVEWRCSQHFGLALGLTMEHTKTEFFNFDNGRSITAPQSIDLGYAPYRGSTPLLAKQYWRYLGFFFDRKLTFKEHIRRYTNKGLSAANALRSLGNSVWGMTPEHRRLLYRVCVLPIATYGFRLWYHRSAQIKTALKPFHVMQNKAAQWITGAFR